MYKNVYKDIILRPRKATVVLETHHQAINTFEKSNSKVLHWNEFLLDCAHIHLSNTIRCANYVQAR